jgi:hypothetical protein
MRRQTKNTCQALAGLLCLAGAASAQGILSTTGTIVAHDGDPVPDQNGLPIPGFTFGGSGALGDAPVLDENGNIFFRARFVDAAGPLNAWDDRAYFHGSSRSTLKMVVRGGDQAPGMSAGVLLRTTTGSSSSLTGTVRVSPDGRVFFGSNVYDGGVTINSANGEAIFGGPVHAQTLLVQKGDVAPGTGGATFTQAFASPSLQSTGINRQGRIWFMGALTNGTGVPAVNTVAGTNNQVGIWSGMPGALELVARKSDPVDGLFGEVAIDTFTTLANVTQMNDSGELLYDVVLSTTQGTPAANDTNDRAYLVHTPGVGSTKLVREGDPAPGTFGGPSMNLATFNALAGEGWSAGTSNNCFSSTGRMIFQTELRGGDVMGGLNDRALYVGDTSGLSMVARRGDAAPGTDAVFASWSNNSLQLNSTGQICVQATLEGGTSAATNDTGVWVGTPGALTLVLREGDIVPGTGGSIAGNLAGTPIYFNDAGQVLFNVALAGGAVTGTSLFGWSAANGLVPVVLAGDQFEVTAGVFKTATTSFSGVAFNNSDGAALHFGHDGRIGVRVGLSDGTNVLVIGRLSSVTPATNFCYGDGSGTACPCGPGAAGNGCPNSIDASGALLQGSGVASLTGDTFVLAGSGMPDSSALYFQGTARAAGGAGILFGDGLRCVAGTVVRLGTQTNAGGASQYPEPADLPVHVKGMIGAPGVRHYQCWYRNANPTFCTPATFNLSNGMQVTWIL